MRTQYDEVIRAWLDGAEVEEMHPELENGKWNPFNVNWVFEGGWQYRISKPAKESKYLYVIAFDKDINAGRFSLEKKLGKKEMMVGKIKLEE